MHEEVFSDRLHPFDRGAPQLPNLAEIAQLQAENDNLRGELATSTAVRRRAAELDGLLQASQESVSNSGPKRRSSSISSSMRA